jgi:hypothetical protein
MQLLPSPQIFWCPWYKFPDDKACPSKLRKDVEVAIEQSYIVTLYTAIMSDSEDNEPFLKQYENETFSFEKSHNQAAGRWNNVSLRTKCAIVTFVTLAYTFLWISIVINIQMRHDKTACPQPGKSYAPKLLIRAFV